MTIAAEPLQERAFYPPRGGTIRMLTRPDTVDGDICTSSIIQDEYGLADLPPMSGLAVDVGAHIGSVTVMLAVMNPGLFVKAVEIVPENVELLRQNAELNGVDDRIEVIPYAAGGPDEMSRVCFMHHRSHPVATPEYVRKHRHIGNSFWSPAYEGAFDSEAIEVPTRSLGDIIEDNACAFLKIDAEGCEWEFLRDPAVAQVDRIHGEFHWDYVGQGDRATMKPGAKRRPKRADTPQKELYRLLGETHELVVWDHPTIGHFMATHR